MSYHPNKYNNSVDKGKESQQTYDSHKTTRKIENLENLMEGMEKRYKSSKSLPKDPLTTEKTENDISTLLGQFYLDFKKYFFPDVFLCSL